MQCHLVYLTGPEAGRSQSFDGARITIGRASTCDFPFDPYRDLAVASNHAEILLDEGIFCIHDLGTRGGTIVNGERITGNHPLRHEDYIQFGKNGPEIIFRRGVATGPDPQHLPPPSPETGEVELISGADAGKLFPVVGAQVCRIGRRADVEVPLDPRGDMVVSGHHCSVEHEEGQFILTDCSRNGTFLNGSQISGSTYLRDGDVLTLGPGGPMARFRVHPPRRIYPNKGGEFPRLTNEPEVTTVGAKTAALRAAEERDALRREAARKGGTQTPGGSVFDEIAKTVEGAARHAPAAPSAPAGTAAGASAAAAMVGATAKPPRVSKALVAAAVLGMFALLCTASVLIYAIRGASKPRAVAPQPKVLPVAEYEKQIVSGKPLKVAAGHFAVEVPSGWNVQEDNAGVSMESADRVMAVDYARGPGLSEKAVLDLLSRGGAAAQKGESRRVGGLAVTYFSASGAERSAIAALHVPAGDVPALALVEAPREVLEKLPDPVLGRILRENLKLQQMQQPATPGTTVAATPSTTVEDTPAPTGAPATAAPTAATAKPGATAPPVTAVASKALRLRVAPPPGWTGKSDEANGVLTLAAPDGLQVRIARDPQRLVASEVFAAMETGGWSVAKAAAGALAVGDTGRTCEVSLFSKPGTQLLLVLVDQANASTVVVYATMKPGLTDAHKDAVTEIVRQIADQSPRK